MCVRNIHRKNLYNGVTGMVTALSKTANTATVNFEGREVTLKKEAFTRLSRDGATVGIRLQVPLKLAYAMTGTLYMFTALSLFIQVVVECLGCLK